MQKATNKQTNKKMALPRFSLISQFLSNRNDFQTTLAQFLHLQFYIYTFFFYSYLTQCQTCKHVSF